MWTRDQWSINANDVTAPLYSVMDTVVGDELKIGGKYVFKLAYPGMCTSLELNGNNNPSGQAACDATEDQEYNIWAQSSSPYTDGQAGLQRVTAYQAIDVPWDGDRWGGLAADNSGATLMNGQPNVRNWHFAVGAYRDWGGRDLFPGPIHSASGAMRASWVELFVWAPPNNNCATGQYDRRVNVGWECTDLTACVLGATYETTAPTNISDRSCSPVTTCDPDGQWEQSAPTLVDDRECRGISNCDRWHYELAGPTSTSDRRCTDITLCNPTTEFEAVSGTASSDRVCLQRTRCTVGDNDNADAQYEETAPTQTTDRVCGACAEGTQVQRDGSCVPARSCTGGAQFTLAGSAGGLDTLCRDVTVCRADEYTAVAATATSNAFCTTAARCDPAVETVVTAATASSDAVCAERCTPCGQGEAIRTPCSAETDRQCVAVAGQVPNTAVTPSIAAAGSDIEIVPAQGGAVTVRGTINVDGLAIGGADVGQWLAGLQHELQAFRTAALAKDAAHLQQIAALQAEVGALRSQVDQLLQHEARHH